MRVEWAVVAALAGCLTACGGGEDPPMSTDLGNDAGTADGGGGNDAGPDLGVDLGCVDSDGDGRGAFECGGDDCDDADATRYPGNIETCDRIGHDEDCNTATLGPDMDGDGLAALTCCNAQPGGAFDCGADCDDSSPDVSPTAPETCNGVDDDCDGVTDEAGGQWRPDCDRDGYGDAAASPLPQCAAPAGAPTCTTAGGVWIATPGDCDDTNAAANPGQVEVCDGFDDDCNGTSDDEPVSTAMCSLPNATPICTAASCQVASCVDPFLDCTGSPGCETDPRTDGAHCNSCGNACDWACNARACDDAASIAVSDRHTCAITAGGRLYCWGSNLHGQLGDGTTTDASRPVPTPVIGAVQVVAAGPRTCARLAGGTVQCWGANLRGERGDTSADDASSPMTVAGITDAVELSASSDTTCARRAGGTVVCWGYNANGQLGDGSTVDRASPVAVMGLSGVVEIAASNYFTCARRTAGTVSCWGSNGNGELGDGLGLDRLSPATTVSGITNAVEIAAGGGHACARLATGALKCWGRNDNGQLGTGTTSVPQRTPVDARILIFGSTSPITGVASVSCGGSSTCVTQTSGFVACTGENTNGSLGDGTTASHAAFVNIGGTLGTATTVEAGGWHTCSLSDYGSIQCWGTNNEGEVGDGTTTHRLVATVVVAP